LLQFIVGVFSVLHGLVHLLYFGQSTRRFELRPGMVWPNGSWAFSRLLGDATTRALASLSLVLIAIAFVAGGIGIFLSQAWWRPVVVVAAAFSAVLIGLLWDGRVQQLDDKGGVGLLIDLAILAALFGLRWPDLGF
jgi:hypothetical protein